MDLAEFEKTIGEERLGRWVALSAPDGTAANKVCVYEQGGSWHTVTTDERAGVIESTRRTFSDASAALLDTLEGARLLKELLGFRA